VYWGGDAPLNSLQGDEQLPERLRQVVRWFQAARRRFKEEKHMSTDPVCGMQVDESKAAGKSTYRDQAYYFCSPQCKQKFDENPDSYTGE
jgi:YHS domain-containing protein